MIHDRCRFALSRVVALILGIEGWDRVGEGWIDMDLSNSIEFQDFGGMAA